MKSIMEVGFKMQVELFQTEDYDEVMLRRHSYKTQSRTCPHLEDLRIMAATGLLGLFKYLLVYSNIFVNILEILSLA